MLFDAMLLKRLICDELLDAEDIKYVDETDWIDSGKYQHQKIIFAYHGKHYAVTVSRSGSYFSDYYYVYEDWRSEIQIECPEVTKKEIVKCEWVECQKEGEA